MSKEREERIMDLWANATVDISTHQPDSLLWFRKGYEAGREDMRREAREIYNEECECPTCGQQGI